MQSQSSKPQVPDREHSVAGFVRERRRAARLTQSQLGEMAGVGKRFVVELEQAKPTLRMDKVNQVLAVFGRHLAPVDSRHQSSPSSVAGDGR